MSHLIAILLFTFTNRWPDSYVDACPEASAVHACLYYSPDSPYVITNVYPSDCSLFEIGTILGTLSTDVTETC